MQKGEHRNRLGQWMSDFRWAMNAMRARRIRRELGFARRVAFDNELRPKLDAPNVIAYPDALYHIKVEDVIRAAQKAALASQ